MKGSGTCTDTRTSTAPSLSWQFSHVATTSGVAFTPKSSTMRVTAWDASAVRSGSSARIRAASRAPASTAIAPALTWPIASTM